MTLRMAALGCLSVQRLNASIVQAQDQVAELLGLMAAVGDM